MGTKFTKTSGLLIIALALITFIFPACKKQQTLKNQKYEFIESLNSFDAVYHGLITSYTSGFISDNQPLQISFNSDVKLKKVYGEIISSKVFDISPKLKGEVYWINEHTIGYKLADKMQENKVYRCKFNIREFIDSPSTLPDFAFDVIVKEQSFKTTEVFYHSVSTETCDISYDVLFVNPIDAQEALKLLDDKTRKAYTCSAQSISDKKVKITLSNIPRSEREYDLAISFNGKALNIKYNEEGNFTIPAKSDFKYVNYYTNNGTKTFTVEFSNPLNPGINILGLVSLSNKTSYKTQIVDNRLNFILESIPGSSSSGYYDEYGDYYEDDDYDNITAYVDAAIKDINLRTLENSLSFDVEFNSSGRPSINWVDKGYIIPGKSDAMIYFNAVNLNSVVLRIIRIYDNNVISFLQDNSFTDTYGVRNVGRLERKVKIALATDDPSKSKTYGIRLADYVDVVSGQLFQVSLDFDMTCYAFDCGTDPIGKEDKDAAYWNNETYDYKTYYYGNYWWREQNNPCNRAFYNDVERKRNILISDIAITAKYASEDFLNIFVRNISDAKPASGCEVLVYNYQKQVIGQAKTDAEGKCRIKPENTPYFIEAKDNNGNKAYIKLEKNQSLSLSNFDVSGNSVKHNVNGFIYSNRDIWRPGDSIHLNFIVADPNNVVPENFPIIMEVYDSQSRLVLKKVNNYPIGNIYSFAFATEPSDPTGLWSATVFLGNQSFYKGLRVETVKPNRLKIDLNLPKMISADKTPSIGLNSTWLNGLAASNLKASVDVVLSNMTMSFSEFAGYSFQNASSSFTSTEVNLCTSMKLNEKGNGNIELKPISRLSLPGFARATFTTKVFEGEGDFSISSSSTTVSPYKRYVGVMLPETKSKYGKYYFTNEKWTFDVALVNENGVLEASSDDLKLRVYKLDSYWWWDSNYENLSKYINGTYKYPVVEETVSLKGGKSKFTLNFKDEQWGAYIIIVEDTKGGHMFSKVVNFDYPYYNRNRNVGDAPSVLSLATDKEVYKVGETISVSFPANKKSLALVCVENSSDVIQSFNVSNLSEEASVKITVTEDMLPNIYIFVSLFQPYASGNDMPIRMFGVIPVKVEDPATKLQPVISMPKETSSKSTVEISVSEKTGKAMYYTIAVVDEGILGITSYKTPDPHKQIFAKQALRVNTWDGYTGIIDAFDGEMNAVFAIGGDEELAESQESVLSKRFQALAYMLGPFELKANATGKHTVKIPEYIGSLRTMVIASNNKNAYGNAQENIIVKDPIMIMPSVPRVVSPNDEFVIPVQVLAPDMAGKNVNVQVSLTKLSVVGKSTVSVPVNSNGEALAEFTIKVAEAAGNAEILVKASVDNVSAESKIILPIRMPFSMKNQIVMEKIDANSTKSINADFKGIDGTMGGQVTLNSLVPIDLFSHLDYLIGFPHGCLEQTTSKAFPQLYLDYFVDFDANKAKEVKEYVDAAISKLKNYLRSDNSMTNWIGGSYVSSWSEIYATHFLIEAKNRGYNVPDDMYKGIIKYHAARAKEWNHSIDYPTADVNQAYRLFILALNNSPEVGAMNKFKELPELQTLSKALLASAYALSGKTKIAQEILAGVQYDPTKMMSDWYITYGSFARDYAILTYANMLIGSDEEYLRQDIVKVAKEFGENRWMSTQTVSFSLFMLGKYAEKNNVTGSKLESNVSINGENHQFSTNKSSAVVDFLPKQKNKVDVTNSTANSIYATVYIKGHVAEYDTVEAGAHITMTVEYFDKSGKSINPKSLAKNTEFYAEITVANPDVRYRITDNALSYILPGGWEIVNNRIANDFYDSNIKYSDIRDDRAYYYFDLMPSSRLKFKVELVATYSGKFTVPQVRCDDMYNNEIFYVVPAMKVQVK